MTSPVQPSSPTGPAPPLTSSEECGDQPCKSLGPFIPSFMHHSFIQQMPIRALLCPRPCLRHWLWQHAGTLPAGGSLFGCMEYITHLQAEARAQPMAEPASWAVQRGRAPQDVQLPHSPHWFLLLSPGNRCPRFKWGGGLDLPSEARRWGCCHPQKTGH